MAKRVKIKQRDNRETEIWFAEQSFGLSGRSIWYKDHTDKWKSDLIEALKDLYEYAHERGVEDARKQMRNALGVR